jgi:hypothetical protein
MTGLDTGCNKGSQIGGNPGMNRNKLITITLLLLLSLPCFARDQFENTLRLDQSTGSPKADLSAVAWIAGHWRGEAFGGVVEEIWTAPLRGSMMAAFKLVVNDQVKFYEIETMRVKCQVE